LGSLSKKLTGKLMGCSNAAAATRTPGIARTLSKTVRSNASPVTWLTVKSTKPDAPCTLACSAVIMVGKMIFIPKITKTPKVTASVVNAVRNFRPLR
jgi:hypothetical protein